MQIFRAIGLMSGTSLDGLDLACCEFFKSKNKWSFNIISAFTFPYPEQWVQALKGAPLLSAYELVQLHKDYGHYLGSVVKDYIQYTGFKPDLVASHGHTIFHRPEVGLTFQLGDGSAIAATSRYPVVCDFRSGDVALGGQGAPLVPFGDAMLFGNFDYCLNLGGFANISYEKGNRRLAYDISPCNMALNLMAEKKGLPFDKDGKMAASGKIMTTLLEKLNQIEYYSRLAPKSLGREWFEEQFLPLLDVPHSHPEDLLKTVTEHISLQILKAAYPRIEGSMLITGGGAHNVYLVDRIRHIVPLDVVIPNSLIVDFKEALIFAFLGILRFTGQVNVLASVSGAQRDHSAGAIYI